MHADTNWRLRQSATHARGPTCRSECRPGRSRPLSYPLRRRSDTKSSADQVKAVSADPRVQPRTLYARDHGGIGKLPDLSGYQHAPTGLGKGVDVIHLKLHGDIRRGRPQPSGARPGLGL